MIAVTVAIACCLLRTPSIHAQTAPSNSPGDAPGLAAIWQGTLHAGQDIRFVFVIAKSDAGYTAVFHSIDQGLDFPVATTRVNGTAVEMTVIANRATYDGKLSPDGATITGTWVQTPNSFPLVLTRTTPETAWTIPKLPEVVRMDQNPPPSFEVATIKPTKPDEARKYVLLGRRQFKAVNNSLDDLIIFAYGLHPKQLVGAPAWAATDKFDIVGEPDREGVPSLDQWKTMLQKLLAERCRLSFHRDQKELPVYVLSVSKAGAKLSTSLGNAMGLPGIGFRRETGGDIAAFNVSIDDFLNFFTRNVKPDRPVLNQTGLTGRYDFMLNWTPDDSQFNGMLKASPSTDNTNPPPDLFTAIQEQLGLRLYATKTRATVYVIDHVEKPSAN
ncbi:MAG: TIGR03435 family protein [Acidobacteriaceae bacterium]